MYQSSTCFTFLSALGIVRFFLSHVDTYVIVSHYGFNLHFLMTSGIENLCMWLFHIHLSSFVSVQIFCSFLNWVVFLLDFESSFYVPDTSTLLDL